MTATAQKEPQTVYRFDPMRLYRAFNALKDQPVGFDRQGNPMDARGKVMPQRDSEKYFLQDGRLFDEAGAQILRPPKHIMEMVRTMQVEHPFPGITHEGKVLHCAASGCGFRTTVEAFYREHKRLHKDITAERWAQLEGGRVKPVAFTLSDFADPKAMVDQFTSGNQPPTSESPQGEG